MSPRPPASPTPPEASGTEALGELRRVVPRMVERTRRQLDFAAAVIERLRCGADGPSEAAPAPAANPAPSPPEPRPDAVAATQPTAGPDASTLAIPDYDALAASQVLPRLAGLGPDELEAIRAYESGHRGRRTILARLAQLQS